MLKAGRSLLEALVELDQIIRQHEADAEGVGHLALDVAQDREGELVVALRLAAVRRRLRRDRDQASAARGDVGKRLLQRLQFEIAVGAPDAAIERNDQRTPGEQFARRDRLAVGIVQREFRRDVAGLPGALRLAACDQLRRWRDSWCPAPPWSAGAATGRISKSALKASRRSCRAMGNLRWLWLARNIWLICRQRGIRQVSDNIYLEYK